MCARHRVLLPCVLALGLLVMMPARATIIELRATGEITEITNATLSTRFAVGQAMTATLRYDVDATPSPSLILTQALYPAAIVDGDVDVDGYVATLGAGNINVSNDDPTFADAITFRALATGAFLGALDPRLFGLRFEDLTAAALSSLALPGVGADLSGLVQTWGLAFGAGLDSTAPGVFGRVTSLELRVAETVPEPGTALLLLGGLGATSLCRRTRTKGASTQR